MNVTTIYDNSVRPDTTGIYVTEAMTNIGHDVTHVNPVLNREVSINGGAKIIVDDGVPYTLHGLDNAAYWAIDTHISMDVCEQKAGAAKFLYAAQKAGAAALTEKLQRQVTWLPLACSRKYHWHHSAAPKTHDICFVGTVNLNPIFDGRRVFLEKMFAEFPNFYFGNRFLREATDKYAISKIVLNYGIKDDVNMRVFETLASGSMLLTNRVGGIEDMFIDGKHLVLFDSIEDAISKARYYLNNGEERELVARTGQEEVLKKHTYEHRAKQIVNEMERALCLL